jgi:cytochrome o ubiquinol oxidase subunit 2
MRRTPILGSVALFAVLALVVIGYAHRADIAVLSPHGAVAFAERSVILVTLLLCAVVAVPVYVLLFYFVVKYREGGAESKREHAPGWDHDSAFAEAVWWLVPTIIIMALAAVAWQSSYALDPYRPLASDTAPLTIEVVALDWKWLFIYPAQGIATLNYIEIPVDTPVTFKLTADAPMNTLWIPALGGQEMAMPGMVNELNLEASEEGAYPGYSGNISGEGFASMAFSVRAVSHDAFDAWVQKAAQSRDPLDTGVYASLARPSIETSEHTYAPVASDLYNRVVNRYAAPGSGMQMTMP